MKNQVINALSNVDYVPSNVEAPTGRAILVIFEDNEAVIKMTIKCRAPALRHVVRTHRIDLDFVFERIKNDPGIFIKYVGTKEQVADIFTKATFTAEQWSTLCKLGLFGEPCKRKRAIPKPGKRGETSGNPGLSGDTPIKVGIKESYDTLRKQNTQVPRTLLSCTSGPSKLSSSRAPPALMRRLFFPLLLCTVGNHCEGMPRNNLINSALSATLGGTQEQIKTR